MKARILLACLNMIATALCWSSSNPSRMGRRSLSRLLFSATETSDSAAPSSPKESKRKSRILSGVQPTGSLHLGNYLGAIQQWVELQETAQTFFCVVDLHAITVQPHDPQALRQSTLSAAALYLACGINPQQSKIFVQSHVPAHAELTWLLSCLTPVNWLYRMIQFKEKSSAKNQESVGTGLLTYPVLMAADILLYQANQVPVGEDQRQHLELARDIARRVHDQFCQGNAYKKRMKAANLPTYPIFTEPTAMIVKNTARIMSLTDGTNKMSKSDRNDQSRINLLDDPATIRAKIKKCKSDDIVGIYKDSKERPEATNLLNLYQAVDPTVNLDDCSKMTWGEFKPKLADAIVQHLEPIQKRYRELMEHPQYLDRVLWEGSVAASAIANDTLHRTRVALGFLEAPSEPSDE